MPPALGLAWRFGALGGLTAGLAAAPLLGDAESSAPLLIAAALAAPALAVAGPRRAAPGRVRRARVGPGACAWLILVAATACAAGVAIGSARVAAIDAGALRLEPGSRVAVDGFVAAVPRRADGEVDVRVDTPEGRLLVEAPEPVADLDIGAAVSATGTIRAPTELERAYLERLGIGRVLATRAITVGEQRRGGLLGVLDRIRERAQRALSVGTPESSSSLLRGFVLGQDDRIAERTANQFKRSGLAHLLAVSGQNVVLLSILAAAALAMLGVGARARLLWLCALIAIYVLVTGAGASIQRAGIMGAAGIVAALAGRPRSRSYVLLVAAAVTLGLDPRATGDIGWQLSFAAVAGILLLAAPLRRLLAGPGSGRGRVALAEAAALTISATVATAPLISLQFGTVSLVSLPANLVAVVAEAPVMWLGMVAAGAGQLSWAPVEPVTWLAGLCAAYIAQVAEWFGSPSWAQVELGLPSAGVLAGVYAGLGGGIALGVRWAERRRRLRPAAGTGRPRTRRRLVAAGAIAGIAAAVALGSTSSGGAAAAGPGLRVSVLDVGQGDSILLEPADGEPVLIDAGPAVAEVASRLAGRGIQALAALVVTHPDSDHAGGAAAVLGSLDVAHLLFARADRVTVGAARASATDPDRVAAGSGLRSGSLRLRVLWPPRHAAGGGAGVGVPNSASLVLLARWHRFRILLTGDAEAELAPVHPGDVDVLKLAHHGSEDAGLAALLAEAEPELAVISVGEDNPYGHPAEATLATLDAAGVPVLRTDADGEVTISVGGGGWSATAQSSDRG
jgi:competence protein ComEC